LVMHLVKSLPAARWAAGRRLSTGAVREGLVPSLTAAPDNAAGQLVKVLVTRRTLTSDENGPTAGRAAHGKTRSV
jgi:hypothetical protein